MWFSSLPSSATLAGGILAATVNALPQNGGGNGGGSGGSSACNNSPNLCDKRYDEVTYLGAHNSYALRDDSTDNSISGNQYFNATLALDAGLRMLQIQTHGDSLNLCHSSCDLLDAGPLSDWLSHINDWMDDNTNEVVTILIVNSGRATASAYQSAYESAGIADKMYEPQSSSDGTSGSQWPTLQKMIDDDKRLVTFATNLESDTSAPGILPEFDYVFETHFQVITLDGFNCTVDRPTRFSSGTSAISEGYLSLVNHFKYAGGSSFLVPDVEHLDIVNSPSTSEDGNLGKHVDQCESEWSKAPNFVLIDFWSEQKPMDAIDSLNGVSSAEGRDDPPDSSSDGVMDRKVGGGAMVAAVLGLMLLV